MGTFRGWFVVFRPYGGFDRFFYRSLHPPCFMMKTRRGKKKKKKAILSFLLSVYSLEAGPYEPRKRPKAGWPVPAERLQIATQNFGGVHYCYSYCDRPRRSSEKVDQQQFPERDFLRTRWTVPIDGATLGFHGWFLNALCFAAARPTNVPVHKEHAWQ